MRNKNTKNQKNLNIFQSFWFKIFLIICFAISMAYLESVIVVYLREMFALHYISTPGNVELVLKLPHFALIKNPLIIVPDLKILFVEIFREVATIVMLLSFALLVGRKWNEKLAIFLLSFGLWDIFYYVFLYLLIKWPSSFTTLDILFLIPLPWLAPVWLPISISCCMILASIFLFRFKKIKNIFS